MESKRIVEPLIYIDQPLFVKPNVIMQDHASSKTEVVSEQELSDKKEVIKEELESNNKKKKFKELTIQQQIEYLVGTPREMPPLRCEVLTDEKRYRGIMMEDNLEHIILRVFGRKNERINKDDITSIRLIGF